MSAKTGWTRLAFGDVVQLVRARSSDPEGDGFARYVGLEHLDPGDLRIRRWGNVSDGTTFTNVFRAGQILFGKRRAYQRKVALADFDGVCSGDIYVFEPKGDESLPELLPFICQTDRFFEHAIGTSAGSLSPRTNWDSLAAFEFQLPPLDEQRRILSVLLRATDLRAASDLVTDRLSALSSSAAAQRFAELWKRYPSQRIGAAVLDSAYGPRFPATDYTPAGNAWTIRTTDFAPRGAIRFETVPGARLDDSVVRQHRLVDGDFLLSRSGEYAGLVRLFNGEDAPDKAFVPAAFLIRFRLNRSVLSPQFLLEYCESPDGARRLQQLATGSAQPNISGTAFMDLKIPLPPLDIQEEVAGMLAWFRRREVDAAGRAKASAKLVAGALAALLD
jgi:type I restriction enzyme S subunit